MKRILAFCLVVILLNSCSSFSKGGKDQHCREPDSKKGLCDPGLVCTDCRYGSYCTENNACPHCGEAGYDCCPKGIGDECRSGLACTNENTCQKCGSEGGPCCSGDTPCVRIGLVCGTEKTCQQCGAENGPCCLGDYCGTELICGEDHLCHSCGVENEICCEDDFCYETVCGSDGICHGEVCTSPGNCQACGKLDEPCCDGSACGMNATCGDKGLCVNCGGLDEPVCENHQCDYWREGMLSEFTACECDGWYIPVDGYCRNPFLINPQTSVDVCLASNDFGETILPGYEVTISDHLMIIKEPPNQGRADYPDWCFWYGAYYQNDTQPCENIGWDEMRAVCLQGENPDDYYVWLKFEED